MIPRVSLGKTGLEVSRLCFGTGSHGWNGHSDQSALGLEGLAGLLRYGYDRGITFWDTADQYGTHSHVAAALGDLDRTAVTVTTKTVAKTYQDATADVERFCRELATDYLDIVLLHCMTEPAWVEQMSGPMEALSRAVERGLVRAVGVSCHNFEALAAAAACDWVEVNLVRINYAGASMCSTPERVRPLIAQMAAAGKGVYGMKVLGCGDGGLTDDPPRGIEYTLSVPGVDAIVVGMVSQRQVDENVDLVAGHGRC